MIEDYDPQKLSQLTYHTLFFYNEGSFVLKHLIQNPTLKKIIKGWDNHTFDRMLMLELWEAKAPPEEMLAQLEERFEKDMALTFEQVHLLDPEIDLETMVKFFKFRGYSQMSDDYFGMPEGGIVELLKQYATDKSKLKEGQLGVVEVLLTQMERFRKGEFTKIVYMLPTVRSLESSQYLRSLFDAYEEIGLTPTVVVYDQSEGEQLDANRAFAAKLGIRHFDRDETLAMADAQGVRELIDCNDGKTFGYAGGRNACFFLTGAVVDGEGCEAMQMGDDDMEMSLGAVFYDMVLPAHEDKEGKPVKRIGHFYGRDTTRMHGPPSFESLTLGQWSIAPRVDYEMDDDNAFNEHALAGATFKMLDCDAAKATMLKPTPLPGEEEDVINRGTLRVWCPPMFHHCGSRLPKGKGLPTRPWSEMEGVIRSKFQTEWGSMVKEISVEHKGVGECSKQLIHELKSGSELQYALMPRLTGEDVKALDAHVAENEADRESLAPIREAYADIDKETVFALKFAVAIANDPDSLERLKEDWGITKEAHPAAWMLYMTEKEVHS